MELQQREAQVWVEQGKQQLQWSLWSIALQPFERAVSIDGNCLAAWEGQAEALRKLGKWNEVVVVDEKIASLRILGVGLDLYFYFGQGNNSSQLGEYEKAIEFYDKAIESKPNLHQAWFNRGNALDGLGRIEEAIDSYNKTIEFKPDDYGAWCNRGLSLAALDRREEAIDSYDKAIEIKPDYHDAWCNRGTSLSAIGREEEAIESYEKAIEIKPDYYAAWHNRAISICSASSNALLKSDIAEFIRHQKETVPSQPRTHLFALREALPYFQDGTIGWGKIHQSLGDAQVKHAGLKTQKEDWKEAVCYYKEALSCFPIESHAYDHLEVLQSIIRILIRLDAIPAARHYQTQGSPLYETLRTQAQDKRTFEAKFSTFRLTEIDLLIDENEPRLALTQAEFYKNRALTWLFDNDQETTLSPTYDRIRSNLTPGTAIVYWHQSDDAITTFILTNDNAEPIVLDCDRQRQHQRFTQWKDQWDKDYDDYRSKKSAMQSDHPWRQQMDDRLKNLKEILNIDAIEQHLKLNETLILIPHRDLHRYPIHTLFKNNPTTHSPSIQAIDRASHPAPSSDCPSLLLINDPDRSSRRPDHRPMPFAQIESAIIQQLINSNATHINHTNATHNTIIQQLTQQNHRYFHFIGHAEHDFQKPENSALDLSDRPLTAKTIANLNLSHLHLATLSSCETSIVSSTTHTEYLGLTSAFLCAGTQTILSTLWQVEEIASAWFMIRFHQLIKTGLSPAIALRHTQTWMQTVTWREFTHWLEELRQLPGLPSFPTLRLESRIQNILQNGDTIDPNQPTEYCNPIHWAAFILTGQG